MRNKKIANLANNLKISYREAQAWDGVFDFLERFSFIDTVKDLEEFAFEHEGNIYKIPAETFKLCKKLLEKHGKGAIGKMFCPFYKDKNLPDFIKWAKENNLKPIDFVQKGVLVRTSTTSQEPEIVYEVVAA